MPESLSALVRTEGGHYRPDQRPWGNHDDQKARSMKQKRRRRIANDCYELKRQKEESLYGLGLEISRACDKFFTKRGIVLDPSPWDKLDFHLED
jgi:hypothetical protein